MKKLALAILVFAFLAGCAGTGGQPITPPPGCENAFFYNQGKNFLPYGPMTIRTGVATALMIEPKAQPAVQLAALAFWDIFKADSPDLMKASKIVEDQVKEARYARPALALFSEIIAQARGSGGQVQMTKCDKDILMGLVKNIGTDAGASPELFK